MLRADVSKNGLVRATTGESHVVRMPDAAPGAVPGGSEPHDSGKDDEGQRGPALHCVTSLRTRHRPIQKPWRSPVTGSPE